MKWCAITSLLSTFNRTVEQLPLLSKPSKARYFTMEPPHRLYSIPGHEQRTNDVLYARPKCQSDSSVVVYFPGDVQDYPEIMESHQVNKNYVKWNLENTTRSLSCKFPSSHIVVVRPSRMELKTFSCFDNFVPSNKFGVPDHVPMNNALTHLEHLLQNVSARLENENHDGTSLERAPHLDQMTMTLLGFSKGCVVLNQFLHEFHHLQTLNESDEAPSFVRRIDAMYWLDGGHSGGKDTWVTSQNVLETLAHLGINIHVHVTPYQIGDDRRPWIRDEEKSFNRRLKGLGVPVNRFVHFSKQEPTLNCHFGVLDVFTPNAA